MGRRIGLLWGLPPCCCDGHRVYEVASITHLEDGRSLCSVHCHGSLSSQGLAVLWQDAVTEKRHPSPGASPLPDPHSLARLIVPLHPTQLYEAGGGLALFLFLIWREKRKSYDGQIFWLFLLLYSILRFLIEIVRDDPRGFLFGNLPLDLSDYRNLLGHPLPFYVKLFK